MKVICDESNNTKEDMEKRQVKITLIPETEKEAEVIQKAKIESSPNENKGRYDKMYATDISSDLYKVYRVRPNSTRYGGFSFVAAESVEEANKYIEDFKKADFLNYQNSLGHSNVDDTDLVDAIVSSRKGIVFEGIDFLG